MRRVLQFVVALVLGLGLVTWIASGLLDRKTRAWFDKDVNLRCVIKQGLRPSKGNSCSAAQHVERPAERNANLPGVALARTVLSACGTTRVLQSPPVLVARRNTCRVYFG
jgi:hypothetical protein